MDECSEDFMVKEIARLARALAVQTHISKESCLYFMILQLPERDRRMLQRLEPRIRAALGIADPQTVR